MYDSVDTFQVLCPVPTEEMRPFLDALLTIYPTYKDTFDRYLAIPAAKIKSTFRTNLPLGIQAINIYKGKVDKSISFIAISVKPEELCSQEKSNRLFRCTCSNVYVLQYWYANAIHQIFPAVFNFNTDEESSGLGLLPYLGLLMPKRIDYAINVHADNVKLTLKMLRGSYLDNTRKQTHFVNKRSSCRREDAPVPDNDTDNDAYISSKNFNLYLKNKSSRNYIYDKQQKYTDCGCSDANLYEEAKGLIRIEAARTKLKRAWIVEKAHLHLLAGESPMGVLPYLDANIANQVLSNFIECFGSQDWYSDEAISIRLDIAVAKAALPAPTNKDGSERKNSPNRTIRECILPIISQSRSIQAAYGNYQSGTYKLAKTGKLITGSAEVFRDYLKLIRSLDLQPLRIPDEDKMRHLDNPLKYPTLAGHDHTNLPLAIMQMPAVVRKINEIWRKDQLQHEGLKR